MLTKFHKILIGILAVQLLLAVLFLTRSADTGTLKEQTLVANFDVAKVTRIQVFADSAEKPSVDLAKRTGNWVLASHFDQPVDTTKVTTALEPISKLAGSKPIATSNTRHGQLRVGDKQFEKKVILSVEGGKDIVLFFGASAGMRRNSFRIAGDDRVWGVTGMHSGSIGNEPSQWIDTAYYKATPADIAKLVVQTDTNKRIEIARVVSAVLSPGAGSGSAGSAAPAPAPAAGSGSGSAGSGSAAPAPVESWQVLVDGAPLKLAADESIDASVIESRLGTIATITMREPGDPKRDASKPTATVEIHKKGAAAPDVLELIALTKDGQVSTKAEDTTDYWVHLKGSPRAALVDMHSLRDIAALDATKLVKKPPPPAPPGGAQPPPNGLPPGIELPPGMDLPPGILPSQ